MNIIKICTLVTLLCSSVKSEAADPLVVSTELWKDPSFVKAFNGSYRINARIEPTLSSQQRGILVQVQKLMQADKREQALTLLTASAETKKSAALLFNMGNIAFELGQVENAISYYLAALKAYPSFLRAHRNLAICYVRNDDFTSALPALQEAVKLGDQDSVTMGMLGYCYLQKEHYASALQAYRMARLTQPESADWKAGAAQCLSEMGEEKQALLLLDEVIEARPDEVSYQLLAAQILHHLGEETSAMATLEWIRRSEKLDVNNSLFLATLYIQHGDGALAKAMLHEIVPKVDESHTGKVLSVAEVLFSMGETEETVYLLDKIRAIENLTPSAVNKQKRLRAMVAIQEGKAGAKELLEEVLNADPLDGESMVLLAGLHQNQSEFAVAELYYQRAIKLESIRYKALIELGKMRVAQKRYTGAIEVLEKALEQDSSADLERYVEAVRRLKDAQ